MNAIFQFENHHLVALDIRRKYLEPKLEQSGLKEDTTIVFVDYLDRDEIGVPMRMPAEVAKEAAEKWKSADPAYAKTVWIWDLDAAGRDRSDSSYGICVMLSLAADELGMSLTDFLSSPNHLNIILTMYAENLAEHHGLDKLETGFRELKEAQKAWRNIAKLKKDAHSPMEDQVGMTQVAVQQPGGRIVIAHSKIDEAWMSEVIIKWLQSH